jgi:hypothetical protein
MQRSVIPALVVTGLFSAAALGGGCVIVTQPGPNNGASSANPPANNQGGSGRGLPVLRTGQPAPTQTAAPTAAPTTPASTGTAPAGPPGPKVTVDGKEYTTLSKAVAFGGPENKPGTFRGFVHFLPPTTTQLPNFDAAPPAGVLFTPGFAVSTPNYTEGFPGLDAGRVEYFGIRYEGDFAVTAPGDYVFKLESDDGARLSIDSLPLVVLDGVHTAQTKTGTVKLAPGPHRLRLDYFQAARGAAALRLSVTPPSGAEKPFSAVLLLAPARLRGERAPRFR